MNRLRELREKAHLRQSELANIIGISQGTLSTWETGRGGIDDAKKLKLARYFQVSVSYLLGWDKLQQEPLNNYANMPDETEKKSSEALTVYQGSDTPALEYLDGYVAVKRRLPGKIEAFRCKDDSMEGLGISRGDTAVVRLRKKITDGQLAVVDIDGDGKIMRIVHHFNDGILLTAANPEFPPLIFTGEDMKKVDMVGRVIEVRKRF